MPSYLKITFMPEGKIVDWCVNDDCFYAMDGYQIQISTWPVWCNQCREFTDGEIIHSLEELTACAARLESGELAREHEQRTAWSTQQYAADAGNVDEKRVRAKRRREKSELRMARREIEWRTQRRSPPRCLGCGTTDIVDFRHDEEVPSPCSDGTVRIEYAGHCRSMNPKAYYTAEGEEITALREQW
jgi:hypothetical protein